MKKFSSTWIFAAVVVVVGALAYWDFKNSQKEAAQQEKKDSLLPDWSVSRVVEIKVVKENSKLHLQRVDYLWKFLEPIQDDANKSQVDSYVKSMMVDKVKEVRSGEIDWAQYGLASPLGSVEFINSDGLSQKIYVSDKKSYDGNYYLRRGDEQKLLLASSSWGTWVGRSVGDLRQKKLFLTLSPIKKMTYKNGKSFSLEQANGEWSVVGKKDYPLDAIKINGIVTSIKNFEATEVVAETRNSKNLQTYRLQNSDFSLTFDLDGEKEPLVITVGRPHKTNTEVFLYTNRKPFIYKTYKSTVERWKLSLKDLKKLDPPKEEPKKKEAE